MTHYVGMWGRFQLFVRAVVLTRAHLVGAALGFVILESGQVQESLRVAADDSTGLMVVSHLTLAMAAVLYASFAIWFVGRRASLETPLRAELNPDDEAVVSVARAAFSPLGPQERQLASLLALLPVVASSGYLLYGASTIARHLMWAHRGSSWEGVVAIAIAVVALPVFTASAIALVASVLAAREPWLLDTGLVRLLFGAAATSSRRPIASDAFGAFSGIMSLIVDGLRALAGEFDGRNVLARLYRLDAIPAIGTLRGQPVSTTGSQPRIVTPGELKNGVPTVWRPPPDPPRWNWSDLRKSMEGVQAVILSLPLLFVVVIPGVLLMAIVCFFGQVSSWPEYIGTVAIAQVFVIAVMAMLVVLHRRQGALFAIAALAVLTATCDLNDTHHIRPLDGTPVRRETLSEGFLSWLDQRADRARFDRYPVYVVAARGGGIYAGYHAAMALARLQDMCPGFAQHLFAVSSVSGGSLGASVFAALAHQATDLPRATRGCRTLDTPGEFERRTRAILSQDFLSPVISAALFPDLALQVVPGCIRDRGPVTLCAKGFDRARALETAFEDAWMRQSPAGQPPPAANPFSSSVYQLWSPGGAAPALLINTTVVETGRRLVIAPFRHLLVADGDDDGRGVSTLLGEDETLDLRLSTAAGISARFPIVTPAAWFRARSGPDASRKIRLVDGGYFDNSGIATALDAIHAMTLAAERAGRQIDIHILVMTGVEPEVPPSYGAGEVLSMVRALLNTRVEHGRRIEELATLELRGPQGAPAAMSYLLLDTGTTTLPLGWQLSERSRRAIDDSLGRPAPAACESRRSMPAAEANACAMAAVRAALE